MVLADTPYTMIDTESFRMRSEHVGANYEITVALPSTYADRKDHHFPLLLILDGNICFGLATDASRIQSYTAEAQEIIVAGVSIPRDEGVASYSLRRIIDFCLVAPRSEGIPAEVRGLLERRFAAAGMSLERDIAGGHKFRQFLTDELLPSLLGQYRINRADIGLFGHSAGGAFAAATLLDHCPQFAHYIIGSYMPSFEDDQGQARAAESRFIARGSDRTITVVAGVGGAELRDPVLGKHFQSGVDQIQRLSDASAPWLKVHRRVFEHEGHGAVMGMLMVSGVRALWSNGKPYSEALKTRT